MMLNKRITALMLFIFAVGAAGGGFFEVFMEGEGKRQLVQLLSGLFSAGAGEGFPVIFWRSFRIWAFAVAIVLLSSRFRLLLTIDAFLPLARGLTLGFSAAMLTEGFGLEGLRHAALTLLPQSLLQVPALCALIALAFDAGARRDLRGASRDYARPFAAAAAVIAASCLLEAFLMKFLL